MELAQAQALVGDDGDLTAIATFHTAESAEDLLEMDLPTLVSPTPVSLRTVSGGNPK